MEKVITATGEEFEIGWIGVATLDGGLRFGIINCNDINKIFQTFTKPENCVVLTRDFDGVRNIKFEGYTVFRGITINYNDEIVVSLSKV